MVRLVCRSIVNYNNLIVERFIAFLIKQAFEGKLEALATVQSTYCNAEQRVLVSLRIIHFLSSVSSRFFVKRAICSLVELPGYLKKVL